MLFTLLILLLNFFVDVDVVLVDDVNIELGDVVLTGKYEPALSHIRSLVIHGSGSF